MKIVMLFLIAVSIFAFNGLKLGNPNLGGTE
jgi:hypothetical protein